MRVVEGALPCPERRAEDCGRAHENEPLSPKSSSDFFHVATFCAQDNGGARAHALRQHFSFTPPTGRHAA